MGTNTYSSALLVGEKGAQLLCEDLGEPAPPIAPFRSLTELSCDRRPQGQDAARPRAPRAGSDGQADDAAAPRVGAAPVPAAHRERLVHGGRADSLWLQA